MIKRVEEQDIAGCVKVIKESFAMVAKEFGFTVENAPGFTAFATTEDRLKYHLFEEHRYVCFLCQRGYCGILFSTCAR